MDDKLYNRLKNNWKLLSEGLVKLPIKIIDVWVDQNIEEIINKLKETYKNKYNTYIEKDLTFVDEYSQEQINITVNIQYSLINANENILSLMHYDKKENAIYISASTILENIKGVDNIKNVLINGIKHELTHVVDPGRKYKKQNFSSYEDYINSDIEFPAFSRQYIELIKNKGYSSKALNAIRTGKDIPIKEIAQWYKKLNPKNKKKFINQLVKEIL